MRGGRARHILHVQRHEMLAHVGVGGRSRERGCAVAMLGEGEPGGQAPRRDGQRVPVDQVGVGGGDGVGVGRVLRRRDDRRAGEGRRVIDVGDANRKGLRVGQAARVGDPQRDGVLAHVGVGGCAAQRGRAIAVID